MDLKLCLFFQGCIDTLTGSGDPIDLSGSIYEDFDKGVGVDLLKKEMLNAAKDLDFEKASKIKDYLDSIKKLWKEY